MQFLLLSHAPPFQPGGPRRATRTPRTRARVTRKKVEGETNSSVTRWLSEGLKDEVVGQRMGRGRSTGRGVRHRQTGPETLSANPKSRGAMLGMVISPLKLFAHSALFQHSAADRIS
eukprot:3319952-Pyramimonas_sp.AAC.1